MMIMPFMELFLHDTIKMGDNATAIRALRYVMVLVRFIEKNYFGSVIVRI